MQRPFEARLPEARQRLMALLQHAAIRASKDDLAAMVKRTHKVPQHPALCTSLLRSQGSMQQHLTPTPGFDMVPKTMSCTKLGCQQISQNTT